MHTLVCTMVPHPHGEVGLTSLEGVCKLVLSTRISMKRPIGLIYSERNLVHIDNPSNASMFILMHICQVHDTCFPGCMYGNR